MSNRLTLILALIAMCSLGLCLMPPTEADWEYMLIKFNWSSTNEDLFRADLRPVRVERGVYAMNGTVVTGIDIDDSYTFALHLLYSSSGSGQWTATPFEVKPTSFYDFVNSSYKEYLNEDLSRCAGVQYVGDEKYEQPLKATRIMVNNCLVKTSSLPSHLRPGYYKLALAVDGPPVKFYAEVIIKVNQKSS